MFAKIFRSMFYGSLAGQADAQLVMVCLVAHADRDGHVELPLPVISALTGLPAERVEAAVALLEGPDPRSRSEEQDGRRLEVIEVGRWLVVNYEKYRSIRDEDDRRRQAREGMRRFRAKKASRTDPPVNTGYPDVSTGYPDVNTSEPALAQAEAEADEDREGEKPKEKPPMFVPPLPDRRPKRIPKPDAVSVPIPDWLPAQAWDAFSAHRLAMDQKRFPWTKAAALFAIAKLARLRADGHDPQRVIEQSILRAWRGLFPPEPEASSEDWWNRTAPMDPEPRRS